MAKTDATGQIIPRNQARRTLASELVALKPEIAKALPKHLDEERMTRIALTALRTTPKLNECTLPSFLGSVLTLAQLGLEPNTPNGHAYLIPRKIKGVMTCTTMIGYEGLLDLVYRSGKVALVYAHVVRDGDVFDYDYGLNRNLIHKPLTDEGEMTHVYAVAELKSGHKAFVVLTRDQVLKRKASAQGAGSPSSPWNTHPEAMWRKTAVRELTKYLPRSSDVATAAAIDEAPEIGKAQTSMLSPQTRDALEAHGVDVDGNEEPDAEEVVYDDAATGT